jgi:hypothetical protein
VQRCRAFLVRESTTIPGHYTLSLRHGKNWHCRIFTNDNGQYYITNNHAFRTVPELIDFYSKRCVSHGALDANC